MESCDEEEKELLEAEKIDDQEQEDAVFVLKWVGLALLLIALCIVWTVRCSTCAS